MQVLKADVINLSDYMTDTAEWHKVRPASEWMNAVVDHFHRPPEMPAVRLGWTKTWGKVDLRDGEVTLWAGVNGHGKSIITSQVALDLCTQGQKVCIASFEMKPHKTMARMTRQAWAASDPSQGFIRDFHKWTDDRLWIYDHLGKVTPDAICAVARYCASELGIKHLFVDNLMKCVAGEDDYNGQKDFVDQLTSVAQAENIHIHLVAHVRKGKDEYDQVGKFSVKGSGAITDLVDNVVIVWRNKKKEALAEGKLHLKNDEADYVMAEGDVILSIEKQRHGEYEGAFHFWFDRDSFQYVENRGEFPHRYKLPKPVESVDMAETVEF
ncbi:hypothetical protein PEP31012_03691 [Pandoraea eparura]|uniref:SF4 helicase domain-containing protein n=1 Tax=Pandoraea eparura TaxID=2508291 RepID=A0A5E4X592_9BURK|nr:AAA family ATPase [Pandoraea eparura]VVE31315.1 hypothetical protein PEP31012_03691 [Pandoraea eparura]